MKTIMMLTMLTIMKVSTEFSPYTAHLKLNDNLTGSSLLPKIRHAKLYLRPINNVLETLNTAALWDHKKEDRT